LSSKEYPKQYLPLAADITMLQDTVLPLSGLDSLADPIIVCNAGHCFLVAQQCQKIGIKTPKILLGKRINKPAQGYFFQLVTE